jgi:hypothetical protein
VISTKDSASCTSQVPTMLSQRRIAGYIAGYEEAVGMPAVSHRELTTVLMTTMMAVGLTDTFTYTAIELVSCLVVSSACACGSEG